MNDHFRDLVLRGITIDLGGRSGASYLERITIPKGSNYKSISILESDNPSILADLEKGIPLKNSSVDNILAFNLFEHVYNSHKLLSEAYRILKKGGRFYASTPFIKEIHADPQDYWRYTPEAWRRMLEENLFRNIKISTYSVGVLTACCALLEMYFPYWVAVLVRLVFLPLDKLLMLIRPNWKDRFVLGVFISASR